MKDYFFFLLVAVLFGAFLSCTTSTAIKKQSLDIDTLGMMDIYLLIGQSNMAGRATIEEQDKDTLSNVFLFTLSKEQPWEKAANPLNKYSSIRKKISMQRLSPAYTFAKQMAASSSGNPIGLVVNAKGGTSIDRWAPDSEFYKAAISRTKAALRYGELKGIAWHQGESDALKYNSYLAKIKTLIDALRLEFNDPDLPVVVGQLSPDKSKRLNFNKMILDLPDHVNKTAVVSTDNTTTTDSSHFDTRSQRLLGERYAKAMQALLLSKN